MDNCQLPKGYKNTEVGVIPEDWEVKELEELTIKIGSGITPTGGSTVYKKDGRPFVRSQNIGWGNLLLDDIAFIDEETHETFPNTEIKLFDVFLNISGASIGRSSIANEKLVGGNVNQHVCIIRTNENNLNPLFLNLFLISKNGQKQIDSFQSGGNRQGLNIGQIRTFQIPIPPTKSEQTAIATALSDADALINSLSTLIAKKRNIKHGAMQKLLQPKEGWEVKKLGDVCDIRKGQLITESTKINGNIPVIAGGKTPAYFHNKPNRIGKTITISGSGASAGYVSFHNYPIFASDCSTIEENDNYSIEFIFYLMQLLQDKIYKMQTGGAQPHIHPRDLNPILVPIPIEKTEQTRIATILSDMDAEIQALETKLEKYRKIKLGMMQNLLTGKIRLIEN